MKYLVYVLLISGAIASCKKKPVACPEASHSVTETDTLYPSPYLAAYPGSTWNYDDNSTETCDGWTSTGLEKTSFVNGCKVTDVTHVAVIQTSFGLLHGSELLKSLMGEPIVPTPLVAEAAGQIFHQTIPLNTGDFETQSADIRTVTVEELLDSMTVLGVTYYDAVHVSQQDVTYFYHLSSGPSETVDSYYARNVGLIRQERVSDITGSSVRSLVSYTLGPH